MYRQNIKVLGTSIPSSELEKLNSLLETSCDLSAIGRNNSLGAHTMSAQTLSCMRGG
jgi:hypothetical protein